MPPDSGPDTSLPNGPLPNAHLRRSVNDAIAAVQELHAVAHLLDGCEVFGDPPPGPRGRSHRSGQLLLSLMARELSALEKKLLLIDMMLN